MEKNSKKWRKTTAFALAAMMVTSVSAIFPQFAMADGSVKTGDYVKLGTYESHPIIWRCVGNDENGTLMFSDSIICYKAFDARGEHTPSVKERTSYGSNLWSESNIRDWLNSDSAAVTYTDTNLPTEENVWNGCNAYDKEAGFLTSFTDAERDAIKSVKLKTPLNPEDIAKADGTYKITLFDGSAAIDANAAEKTTDASYQYTNDKIFLLDTDQLKLVKDKLSDKYYGVDASKALTIGGYKGSGSNMTDSYFLRTPKLEVNSGANVYTVDKNGSDTYCSSFNLAYMVLGIRPGFYLNDNVSFISGSGTESDPYIVSSEATNNTSKTEKKVLTVQNNNGTIKLFNGDKEIVFDDAQPFIDENGRTQIPIRAVAEQLNYDVQYDEDNKTVTIKSDDKTITLMIGSHEMICNGQTVVMDTAAEISESRTYIPIRFVGEALGYDVEYAENVTGWTTNEKGEIVMMTESGEADSIKVTH